MLDEPLPRRLATLLADVGCPTEAFPTAWKGLKDGALLDALEADGCQVLVTCDRNMAFQQTIAHRSVALIVVSGQRLQVLAPLVGAIAHAVKMAEPGTVSAVPTSSGARIPRI